MATKPGFTESKTSEVNLIGTDVSEFSTKKSKKSLKTQKQKTPIWTTKIMAETLDRRLYLRASLWETIQYAIFTALITIISIGMICPSMYYMTKILKNLFVDSTFKSMNNTACKFNQILSSADVWAYLKYALFDIFYWEDWYEDIEFDEDDENAKIKYENTLLGTPRLRQLRVRNNTCQVHPLFQHSIYACYGEYSWENRATDPFGPGVGTAWTYTHPEDLHDAPYYGYANVYDGGGYYQDFHMWKNESQALLQNLKTNLWLTRETRAVFLEFTVYNSNLNLFCAVKVAFEFPPTGGIIPTSSFHTLKLIRYVTKWDDMILGCECAFFVFIFYYTCEYIREIFYLKCKIFKHFWKYVDTFILLLAYLYLFCAIQRYQTVIDTLKELALHKTRHPNFEMAAMWQLHHNNIIGGLVFMIYLKIFKYISFNKTMAVLNNTVKKCIMDVLGFSVMFFIVFMAFAQLGLLLFGRKLEQFCTFGIATFTLLRTILGDFNYKDIESVNRILAPLYFITFICFVFFILMNMFLAIITDTYAEVKAEIVEDTDELQLTTYLKDKFYAGMKGVGLSCLVHEVKKQPSEEDVNSKELKVALSRCGFSELEIDMFFSRFNVNPAAIVGPYNVQEILNHLENHSPHDDQAEYDKEQMFFRTTDGQPLIAVEDFQSQRERVDAIDDKLNYMLEKVDKLQGELNSLNFAKTP